MTAMSAAHPRKVSDRDLAVATRLADSIATVIRTTTKMKAGVAPDGQRGEWTSFHALAILSDAGPMRQSHLAEAMHVDTSTISRQIAHLVESALVERRNDPTDGRACDLACTDSGEQLVRIHRRARGEYVAGLIHDWTPADQRLLTELLERFSTVLADSLTGRCSPDETESS